MLRLEFVIFGLSSNWKIKNFLGIGWNAVYYIILRWEYRSSEFVQPEIHRSVLLF